jgi:plastocyanin
MSDVDVDHVEPTGRSGLIRWVVLLVLLPGVVVGALAIGRSLADDDEGFRIEDAADATSFDHEYLIPLGTADRIAAGEEVAIVPRELVVHVGESIRIVNEDEQGHQVGIFYVGPGQTLTQRFRSAGELENSCTVHPSGAFTLRVLDP